MTYNKDEVIENAQADPAYPWLDRRGHNVLASWGYIAEGLYSSEEQIKDRNITQFGETYPGQLVKPGDIMYKDLNGDGVSDIIRVSPVTITDGTDTENHIYVLCKPQ